MSLIGRFCCRSRLQRIGAFGLSLRAAAYAMHRTTSNQRYEPPQVLGNGSQNEFILGASWTTKSKPIKLQDALQVCEPHLCAHVATSQSLRCQQRPGNVSGVFMDVARQRDGSFGQHWGMSGHTSQSSLLARNRSVFLRSVERRKLGLRLTSARRQNQSQLGSASSDRSCVASKLLRDRWRTRLQLREFDQELDLVLCTNTLFWGLRCHRSLRRIERI